MLFLKLLLPGLSLPWLTAVKTSDTGQDEEAVDLELTALTLGKLFKEGDLNFLSESEQSRHSTLVESSPIATQAFVSLAQGPPKADPALTTPAPRPKPYLEFTEEDLAQGVLSQAEIEMLPVTQTENTWPWTFYLELDD